MSSCSWKIRLPTSRVSGTSQTSPPLRILLLSLPPYGIFFGGGGVLSPVTLMLSLDVAKLQNTMRLSADGADLGSRKANMTFLGCSTSKTMRQVHIFSLGRTQAHVLWYSRATWRKTCVTPSPFRILGTCRAFEELVWKIAWKKWKQMLKPFLHH